MIFFPNGDLEGVQKKMDSYWLKTKTSNKEFSITISDWILKIIYFLS